MKLLNILVRPAIFIFSKLSKLPADKRVQIITTILQEWTSLETNPSASLRMLLELERELYSLTRKASTRYGGGLHTKHKHIKYHNFFIDNINPGEYVLDIGCGNGFLSHDIVTHVKNVKLIGIDMSHYKINIAQKTYKHPNLKFVLGNALTDLPNEKFDVIVLSNVLEHIENRVEFLTQIKKRIAPSRYLIRVPIFERDWRVPLMKELGIDYRLDQTHCIEYTQDEFFGELENAGLMAETYEIGWGEIWALVKSI